MKDNVQERMLFSVVDTGSASLPKYTENQNSKGFVNYGSDNKFPEFPKMLATESATVASIIKGTVRYICGNGIHTSVPRWEGSVNRKGDDLNDIVEALATDLMIYGGFALQVIYSKLGSVAELFALDFARCRTDESGRKVYYAKRRWGSYTQDYDVYDAFDRDHIDPEKMTQIYYCNGNVRTVYPRPSWEGCFRDALSEIEASKLALSQLENGLVAKTVITLPNDASNLTPDEKKLVEQAIRDKFTGVGPGKSSFMIFWREEGMQDLKVDSITTEDDTARYTELKKASRENIFVSFQCTPELMGLPRENQGFDTSQVMDEFKLYEKTVVGPAQKKILKVLRKVTEAQDLNILPFSLDELKEEE